MDFALHGPINKLSFGNTFICILREIHKRGLQPYIFTIGNDDFGGFQLSNDFLSWFNSCKAKSLKSYKRDIPVVKLWHLNGSLESFGKNQTLFTFYELDSPTEVELNIVRNNKRVIFSSKCAKDIFEQFGCENVTNVPLGFDSDSFYRIDNRQYHESGVISFNLGGKLELRKHSMIILNLWAKKFGNNPKYKLNCALHNPFLPPEAQNNIVNIALEGKRFFNISFLPFMENNAAFNDYLNSSEIDLTGLSGGEGWNLVPFQSMCLGKYPVVLNCSSHKDWANSENSILVNPTGKKPAYDGVFFQEGQPFNQGNIFTFNEEDFYDGCDRAIQKVQKTLINENGVLAGEEFTWEKAVNSILNDHV